MWLSAGQPVALTKWLSVSPIPRAFRFIASTNAASEPDSPSARTIPASLPDWTMIPAQQILEPHLFVDFDERFRAARLPGFPAHHELVVEREFAALELLEDHVDRHELTQGGGRRRDVAVLVEQDRAGLKVDDVGLFGRRLHPAGSRHRKAE